MLILIPIFIVSICIISNLNENTLSGLLGHHYYEDQDTLENNDNSDSELENELSDDEQELYDEMFIKKNN